MTGVRHVYVNDIIQLFQGLLTRKLERDLKTFHSYFEWHQIQGITKYHSGATRCVSLHQTGHTFIVPRLKYPLGSSSNKDNHVYFLLHVFWLILLYCFVKLYYFVYKCRFHATMVTWYHNSTIWHHYSSTMATIHIYYIGCYRPHVGILFEVLRNQYQIWYGPCMASRHIRSSSARMYNSTHRTGKEWQSLESIYLKLIKMGLEVCVKSFPSGNEMQDFWKCGTDGSLAWS